MKRNRLLSALAVVAALSGSAALSSSPVYADAAEVAAPAVGVVDIQKVLADLPVTKKIQTDLEALRKKFTEEVGKYETELKKSEQGILKAQKELSEAEFGKKRETFEKRVAEITKIVEDRKAKLEKAFAAAMEKVNEKVSAAIADVAKEKKLNTVFYTMSVAYSDPALDISGAVTEIVKKNLTEVKIEMPSDK